MFEFLTEILRKLSEKVMAFLFILVYIWDNSAILRPISRIKISFDSTCKAASNGVTRTNVWITFDVENPEFQFPKMGLHGIFMLLLVSSLPQKKFWLHRNLNLEFILDEEEERAWKKAERLTDVHPMAHNTTERKREGDKLLVHSRTIQV
jgi:hypothetical protein